MQGKTKSALLVAKPGPLREGLYALLSTVPQISSVNKTSDADTTRQALTEHTPDLVLLDGNLPSNGIYSLIDEIKTRAKESRCLVLVDTIQQQKQAQAAGADAVLPKGYPAAQLFQVIEQLLTETQPLSAQEQDNC
jgi:DNA-binding NarL/FixJ family response regulator